MAPATSPTLAALRSALRDYKAAQCRDADPEFVARANERIPVETINAENAALPQLFEAETPVGQPTFLAVVRHNGVTR